ncbi:MAG: DUF6067 family protein [Desulforhopalus sp.]|nr:DUF6067 family protein [Desulforhopalus sp.]
MTKSSRFVFPILLAAFFLVCVLRNSYCWPIDSNMKEKTASNRSIIQKSLKVQAWKGKGGGGATSEFEKLTSDQVLFAESTEDDSQTVIVTDKIDFQLRSQHYYALKVEVLSSSVENYFDFITALRLGSNKDVHQQYTGGTENWETLTLLINPLEDETPKYIALRLNGKGKIYAKPFYLTELTKEEFEQSKGLLADQIKNRGSKRLEKVFLPYVPSLPLPEDDAPLQFRIWGMQEDQFPPPPIGWRQVPMERAEIEHSLVPRLKDTGYLLYTRPAVTPVYLESVPKEKELITNLNVQATPGEYEPVTFSVYAAKDLEGIRVSITDLKSADGEVIDKKNVDIRTVNFIRKIKNKEKKTYYMMPLTLGKGPDWIGEKTSRRYWLTVYVPPTARAASYRGAIHFEGKNFQKATIPVAMDVMPFTLLDPPVVRFMWSAPSAITEANELKMYQDLAEHGMTSMLIHGEVKTRDQHVGPEDIDHIIKNIEKHLGYYHRVGFRDNPIGGITGHQITHYWDKDIKWFKYWPITRELDDEFLETYRKVYIDNQSSSKWPEFYHYIADEPGGMRPENIDPTAHYLEIFKKKYPALKTFVTIGGGLKRGYDEVGKLTPNLDVTCTNYFTKEVVGRIEKYKSDYWVYNGASLNEQPIKERFFYGWYFWKTGAKGGGQWVYSWRGNPFSQPFRDERQDYALETKTGFLPTVGLEMIREGIDDYRYIYTLSSLLIFTEKTKNSIVFQKVKKKQDETVEKINLNFLRGTDVPESNSVGVSPEELVMFRNETINSILTLINEQKSALSEIRKMNSAQQLDILRKLSERDWFLPPKSQKNSPDLLENIRWGGALSEWKPQFWKGSGKSEYNEKNYQQRKVFKLIITSDGKDDNGAIFLSKPNIILKGRTKYRLSAWLKTDEVSRNAMLYAAVRNGGVADVMSEKMSGTSDWKYVWLEFEPDEDCRAEYFAMRLWGSGVVYVDRIMLQEI